MRKYKVYFLNDRRPEDFAEHYLEKDVTGFFIETRHTRLPVVGVLFLAAFFAAFVGCGHKEKTSPLGAGLVRIGRCKPPLMVDAWTFEGETVYPESRLLESQSEIEILPLAFGPERKGARFEGHLRCDGGEESLILSVEPIFSESEFAEGETGFDIISQRERIDLSRWTGRRVSLRWTLRVGDRPLFGAVAMPVIRAQVSSPKHTGIGHEGDLPQILLICSDTHRFDHAFGAEGKELMPTLQRMRQNAVFYSRAYSNSSWTMPSISSTLTGLFPRHHTTGFRSGTMSLEELEAEGAPTGCFAFKLKTGCRILTVYPQQLDTAAEILRSVGYRTAMIATNPLYTLSGIAGDGQDVVVRTGVVPWQEVNHAARGLIAKRPKDRPFCLLLHYMDVHQWNPWYYSKRWPDRAAADNPNGVKESYAAAVRDCDKALEELLNIWSHEVGLERSLVVFYSDHGEHLLAGDHPRLGHGNSQDEALLHIPLLVRYPDGWGIDPREDDQPVSLCDLFPTFLDAAGITPPEHIDGTSLLRLNAESMPRRFFSDSQLVGDEMASVREGSFKLILNFADGSRTLVDLNVASGKAGGVATGSEHQDTLRRLTEAYETYRVNAERRTRGLIPETTVDLEEVQEGMRQLGYTR